MRLTLIAVALASSLNAACSALPSFSAVEPAAVDSPSLDGLTRANQRELSYAKFDAPTGITAFDDHQRNQHALTRTRSKVFVIVANEPPAPIKKAASAIPKEAVPVPKLERPPVQSRAPLIEYPVSIHFATNSADITGAANEELAKLAELARTDDIVILSGHTDSIGSANDNRALGKRRAEAVRQHLLSRGVDAQRLSVESLGESAPIASNDSEAGRALNRRVEVRQK